MDGVTLIYGVACTLIGVSLVHVCSWFTNMHRQARKDARTARRMRRAIALQDRADAMARCLAEADRSGRHACQTDDYRAAQTILIRLAEEMEELQGEM